jgi:hypothetical protein
MVGFTQWKHEGSFMIVAEIELLSSHGHMVAAHGQHTIRFDCLETAKAEYQRIVTLLERREKKANDLPVMLEVIGAGNQASLPLDDVRSVALCDFATANRQRSGLKEAFPNLFA